MRGSSKRFAAIESKSLNLAVVGTEEDTLKIFENGSWGRTPFLLPEHVALWLLRAWAHFTHLNPPIHVIKCVEGQVFF